MEYQQALSNLHSLTGLGIRPGLQRMQRLLELLGHPEQSDCRYIHIAGTNGKGSTAAMLTAMLLAEGACVGTFTSPHLHHHCERYRINNRQMSEAAFAQVFSQVLDAMATMHAEGADSPTEFEAVTATALLWFHQQQVPYVVLECGLGGRLDSTNVVTPAVSIITSVGIDHENFLGAGLANIAREKAGIIKPGVPLVTAAEGEAADIIAAVAAEQGAPLYRLGQEFRLSAAGDVFTLRTERQTYDSLHCRLLGAHQQQNAASAVQAAELLGLSEQAIRRGLAEVSWPGRLEVLSEQPLIVLDGAHNEQGMAVLAAAIRRYWPKRRIVAVLGMLADKHREQALAQLLPLLDRAVITRPPLAERAGDWQRLADICTAAAVPAQVQADVGAALAAARAELTAGRADMLLVAGSLYLLADMRKMLKEALPDE